MIFTYLAQVASFKLVTVSRSAWTTRYDANLWCWTLCSERMIYVCFPLSWFSFLKFAWQIFDYLCLTPHLVTDKWWLRIARRHFRHYLFTFKKTVTYILTMNPATTEYEVLVRQRGMQISLEVMKRLYEVMFKYGWLFFWFSSITSTVILSTTNSILRWTTFVLYCDLPYSNTSSIW